MRKKIRKARKRYRYMVNILRDHGLVKKLDKINNGPLQNSLLKVRAKCFELRMLNSENAEYYN